MKFIDMIKNHLTSTFRNILKNGYFSFINVMGMAIAFAVVLLVIQYVRVETSYEYHQDRRDRIQRVQLDRTYPDRVDRSAGVTAGVGPAMNEQFPEVVNFTKLWNASFLNINVTNGDKTMMQKNVFFADSAFFKIFSFPLIAGDINTVLKPINTLAISRSTALKYFGDQTALNKSLRFFNGWSTRDGC